jgi:hypothetical protein
MWEDMLRLHALYILGLEYPQILALIDSGFLEPILQGCHLMTACPFRFSSM